MIDAIDENSNPALARNFAEIFLTILMFGVFIPAVLFSSIQNPPRAWIWFLSSVVAAIDLSGIQSIIVLQSGSIILGGLILKAILYDYQNNESNLPKRLKLYWSLFGFGLIILGFRVIDPSHYTAIAGIHYLVLGPILLTFCYIHHGFKSDGFIQYGYEIFMLLMVFAITLPIFSPELHNLSQKIASIAGMLLIIFFVFGIIKRKKLVVRV